MKGYLIIHRNKSFSEMYVCMCLGYFALKRKEKVYIKVGKEQGKVIWYCIKLRNYSISQSPN